MRGGTRQIKAPSSLLADGQQTGAADGVASSQQLQPPAPHLHADDASSDACTDLG